MSNNYCEVEVMKWKKNNSDVHEAVSMMVNKVIGKKYMMKLNKYIYKIL